MKAYLFKLFYKKRKGKRYLYHETIFCKKNKIVSNDLATLFNLSSDEAFSKIKDALSIGKK